MLWGAQAAGATAETLRELADRARDAQAALAAHVSELPLALAHLAAVLPAVAAQGSGDGPQATAGLAGAFAPHLDAMDAQASTCPLGVYFGVQGLTAAMIRGYKAHSCCTCTFHFAGRWLKKLGLLVLLMYRWIMQTAAILSVGLVATCAAW